jgi:hypothetical protein
MGRKRADNTGMHSISSGPARPYGICPNCGRNKPLHWVSKSACFCYDCKRREGIVDAKSHQPSGPFYNEPEKNPYSAAGRRGAFIRQGSSQKKGNDSLGLAHMQKVLSSRDAQIVPPSNQKKNAKMPHVPPTQDQEWLLQRELLEKSQRLAEQQKKASE